MPSPMAMVGFPLASNVTTVAAAAAERFNGSKSKVCGYTVAVGPSLSLAAAAPNILIDEIIFAPLEIRVRNRRNNQSEACPSS